MHKEKLSGVFAPVVTPFEGDAIRYDWLQENLEKMGKTPLTGYLALGSNGEFMSLSTEEQIKVLEVFMKYKGDKTVMAGTARESTIQTIEFSKRAAGLGVDYVSVLTPHYFAKHISDDVLLGYYTDVADNVPVPVLLYNAPGFTGGVQLSASVVRKLAAHPNIVGMKDSSPAGMNSFLAATKDNDTFHVLAGSANFFFTALILGATGGVLSLANCLPEECCTLYDKTLSGNIEEAIALHYKIISLNKAVSGSGGVAAVKAAMDICGYHGGLPRKPLIPVSDAIRTSIQEVLSAQ